MRYPSSRVDSHAQPQAAAIGHVARRLQFRSLMLGRCLMLGCLMAICCSLAGVTLAANSSANTAPVGQLPAGVTPVNYVLDLDIDPHAARFSGSVLIGVDVAAPVSVLWLHGRDLKVTQAEAQLPNGETRTGTFAQRTPDGVASLTFGSALPVGRAMLRLVFSAPYNEQLAGIYKVRVGGDDYVFSQFEAIDARRAFPCFDEPRFKTPFTVTITAPATAVAVANGAEDGVTTSVDGRRTVTFASTPPLPTYLVALAVGPFDIVEGAPLPATAMRDRSVRVRGLAVRGKGVLLKDALTMTPALVTRLETYFDQPYPFAKLDIVAVPDFAAGAMENAALITYRDSIVLLDRNAPPRQRRALTLAHAHELAHQWVGDLVTPVWWDDIWLNESFANWMEQKIAQDLQPAEHFARGHLRGTLEAMSQDSLPSARRIREPVNNSDDIANLFDGITYAKGAGVLSMLESYVGTDKFRDGVRKHLRAHAFGSATAADFLQSIVETTGEAGVGAALSSFIDQTGVPLINAQLECGRNGARLQLSQQSYRQLGQRQPLQRKRWQIPVCIRTPQGRQCKLLDEASATMPLPSCPAWVMPNADGAGYYRFRVSKPGTAALFANLASLSDLEQMAFADSVLAGFRAGDESYATVLNLAAALANSPAREVATAPLELLEIVQERLLDDATRVAAAKKITAIYGPALARLDLKQADQRLLAGTLTRFIAMRGDDPALRARLADAGLRFLGNAGDGEVHADAVDGELVGIALIMAVRERGVPVFDLIETKLSHLEHSVYRDLLVAALGNASDPALLQRARALLLAGKLRRAEVDALAFALFADDRTAPSWAWLKPNVAALIAAGSTGMSTALPYLATPFCSEPEAKDVRVFLTPRVGGWEGAPRALAQTLDSIAFCTALKRAQGEGARRTYSKLAGNVAP